MHGPASFCNEMYDVNASRRYLLISPCRDEAQYLRRTLDSVAAQSIPPAHWVVVDDASTEGTPAIIEEYGHRLPHLRTVRRTDRGCREVWLGVIEAFCIGLERFAWRTSTICASWTWIWTCRSATSSC